MPTQGQQRYTVVGFSYELDWRELNFAEPIPSNRICQACGLVTTMTAFLPCLHVFCKKCYEQCRHDDAYGCPLDGQKCREGDVQWMEFPVENLFSRKVKCWNEDRGCDKILVASELNRHFCLDCDHHSTSCPRCSASILCSNVCAHIQSECRHLQMSATPKDLFSNFSDQKATMSALNAIIDGRVGEVKQMLHQVQNDNNGQSQRLDEISHCLNTVRDTQLAMSSKIDALGPTAHSTERIDETLAEKLHELEAMISSSTETSKEALADTKPSAELVQEDTRNTAQTNLRELLVGENGALREAL